MVHMVVKVVIGAGRGAHVEGWVMHRMDHLVMPRRFQRRGRPSWHQVAWGMFTGNHTLEVTSCWARWTPSVQRWQPQVRQVHGQCQAPRCRRHNRARTQCRTCRTGMHPPPTVPPVPPLPSSTTSTSHIRGLGLGLGRRLGLRLGLDSTRLTCVGRAGRGYAGGASCTWLQRRGPWRRLREGGLKTLMPFGPTSDGFGGGM